MRYFIMASSAFALISGPVSAAVVWTGSFQGRITSGGETTNYWYKPPSFVDLTGTLFKANLYFTSYQLAGTDPVETYEYMLLGAYGGGGQSSSQNGQTSHSLSITNNVLFAHVWDGSTGALSNAYSSASISFDLKTHKGAGSAWTFQPAWHPEIAEYITSVEFELISGSIYGVVPEPAAWALMLAGFGLAGGAIRVRRRIQVETALEGLD